MKIYELKKYIFENSLQSKILEELGLSNIREDDKKIQCSNIDGDNSTAILIYKNNESLLVIDYTRDITDEYNNSDIIALVEFVKNCDYSEAIQWILEILNINNDFKQKNVTEQDKIDYLLSHSNLLEDEEENTLLPEISENTLNGFLDWNNTEFLKDNISCKTQTEFELGIDVFSHRVTIPIRDEFGRLVGIKGRRVWDTVDELNPKYIYIKECEKSKILYGLYKTLQYIQEKGEVIICESEKGVMQLWTYDSKNAVGIGGHSFSDWQIRRLEELNVDIIVAFDKDVEINVIEKELEKFETENNLYYILDTKNLLEDKESPMDNEEKWAKLYNNKRLYCPAPTENDWEV